MTKPHPSRSSHSGLSRIVRLFVERAGTPDSSDPRAVLKRLVAELKKTVRWTKKTPQIEAAQAVRGILQTRYGIENGGDGLLEPLGASFDYGFRLYLNAKAPKARVRFTQAHEICHTFFYQFVPELKFQPHPEDAQEERLCNFGAAELLMPERSLRADAKPLLRTIDSLLFLADSYGVSIEAMLSRLRYLRLWNCELYFWHRRESGDFVLDRVIGERYQNWTWTDAMVPDYAWRRGRCSGHSYLQCHIGSDSRHFKSISFDARREGCGLLVLSGSSQVERTMPLWEAMRARSSMSVKF